MTDQSSLEALRQEEYTGENRCLPCTIINVLIAAVLAIAGGKSVKRVAGQTAGRIAVLVLAAAFAALIYLRGYLVPGTPTLTKRYLPEDVLRAFGKEPEHGSAPAALDDHIADKVERDTTSSASSAGATTTDQDTTDDDSAGDEPADEGQAERHPADDDSLGSDQSAADDVTASTDMTAADATTSTDEPADDPAADREWETIEKVEDLRENAVNPEQFLSEEDVVEPCPDRDDIRLTEAFVSVVEEHLEKFDDRSDVSDATLGELYDADASDVEFQDREYPAAVVGRRVRKWPTDGALVLDVATHSALVDWTDRWLDVPYEQRADILESLRSFRERCPDCDGALAFSPETVESCCGTYEVVAYKCQDCDTHLVELDPTRIEGSTGIEA